MIRKLGWVVGALVFVAVLITIAPAALVPRILSVPHVSLQSTQGTVWRGSAESSFKDQHVGTLTWRIRPLALLTGKLTADLTLEGDGISLVGVALSQFDTREIVINGKIGSRFVNVLTLAYDISLSGELDVNDVKIGINDDGQLESVRGNLEWNGGPVRFKLTNVIHEVTLEPVIGTLSRDAGLIELGVRRVESEAPVLAFRFNPESGWVHLRAFPAFLEFANVPPNYLMQDADFLFEVSQKIL